MSPKELPRIRPMKLRQRRGVLVQSPYDEYFVAQLKGHVPRGDRWWNEHKKGWWVSDEHRQLVKHLAMETYGAVVMVDEEGKSTIYDGRTGEVISQESLF